MNKVELASEIASLMMDEHYVGDPWMKEDEDGNYSIVEEEKQDRFNEYYDEALILVNKFTEDRKEILEKVNACIEDMQMLKAGTWVPDDSSCSATLDNLTDIKNYIKHE